MKVIFAEIIMKNIINISVLVHCTCSLFCRPEYLQTRYGKNADSKDKEKH